MLISGLAMPATWPEAVRVMVAQARASLVWAQRSSSDWPSWAWIALETRIREKASSIEPPFAQLASLRNAGSQTPLKL